MIRARHAVRRQRDKYEDVQVRQARKLVRRLDAGPLDVLYLGDSAVIWTSPSDVDGRNLREMVVDDLGPNVSVHAIFGASFAAAIFTEYLRIVERSGQRPLVIHPIFVRGGVGQVMEHPVHSHRHSIAAINAIASSAGRVSPRAVRRRRPDDEAFQEFYAKPYTTILGQGLVGDYAVPLGDASRWTGMDDPERVRLIYAYHQGVPLEPGSPGVRNIGTMAALLKSLGCPVVAYENAVCVERGVEVLGPEFSALVERNYELCRAAYRAELGADTPYIELGTAFGKEAFVDPDDASEHLNEAGRRRTADLVVAEVRRQLARR